MKLSNIFIKDILTETAVHNCWTCGIQFKKEKEMKIHMKTVKHQLEAKKLTVQEEIPAVLPERSNTTVQVILETYTETVKSNVSEQSNQISTEMHAEERKETILNPNIYDQNDGKDFRTDISPDKTTTPQGTESTDNTHKCMQIDQVVDQLLEALNEDNSPTSQEEIQKIINQYHECDEDLIAIRLANN